MSLYNRQLGLKGELEAASWLKGNNFIIVKTNFRSKFGEIDIIAKKDRKLFFIEVKTRANLDKGYPYEAVNKRKIHNLKSAAYYFLLKNDFKNYRLSIGVISILYEDEKIVQFKFFENVER